MVAAHRHSNQALQASPVIASHAGMPSLSKRRSACLSAIVRWHRVAHVIVYASFSDAGLIRDWINADPNTAWISKIAQSGCVYTWKADHALSTLEQTSYALWQPTTGPLNIPSGADGVPDTWVADPFSGWEQTLSDAHSETPWFGGNLPGPIIFTWHEKGRERPNSLGRSEFSWLGSRYASIGKPAHPDALRWWSRLRRFVAKNGTQIRWPYGDETSTRFAYAFPTAMEQIRQGRYPDANP
jgi:hypothetical protein